MNVKIKSTGVARLIGDDYDRVYTALKTKLGDGDEQLFTERIPGHEYLQWELPGEGWVPLSEADPLMSQEVRQELIRRKQLFCQRFGQNQEMAQKILSVPDDSYVYYKADANGHLLIRLTAWGYRFPERIGGGGSSGIHIPVVDTEHVCIHIMYDNKPLANKQFFVNDLLRVTDSSGKYEIGDLPIDFKFTVRVDNHSQTVCVLRGQGDIEIDVTEYATVEVKATLDDQPYVGANVLLSYMDREQQLTTDATGMAVAKVPVDPENGMYTASIGDDHKQFALIPPVTVVTFVLSTPEEEEEEGEDHDDSGQTTDLTDDGENGGETDGHTDGLTDQEIVEKDPPVDDSFVQEEKPEPPVPPVPPVPQPDKEKRSISSIIWEIVAALSLLLIVFLTYLFCYGMLFG